MGVTIKPHTFVDGTIAEASEVNADFDPLYTTFSSGIDSENLAPSGITSPRIGTSAVITRTINDFAVIHEKLDTPSYIKLFSEVFG